MTVRILRGDCRAVLREIPADSIHCCVTSPPYWQLRNYGVEPTIWGGDDACAHEWGDAIAVNATNHTDKRRWNHTHNGRGEEQPAEKRVARLRTKARQSQFCQLCGAWAGAHGLEPSFELFVANELLVFRAVWRVLRPDGTLWLNLGDSYAGSGRGGSIGNASTLEGAPSRKSRLPHEVGSSARDAAQTNSGRRASRKAFDDKQLIGIPWRVAFALQADGWFLRQDIVWHKPNPMPESVTERCTKAHEYLFLLTKSERYFFDQDAILEPASPITHARLSQDTLAQRGSDRAHGGARGNGNMKAVGRGLVPGNRTHRGADAAADGELGHRTKTGLVDHAKRSRATLAEGVKNNGSFDAAMAEMPIERNKRSVCTITTQPFKEAHFATFPPKLVEPCIMAGTSARGVCPSCGCPWRRVTGRERVMDGDVAVVGEWAADDAGRLGASGVGHWRFSTTRKTLGWYPDCACAGLPALPRLPRRPIQRQDEPDYDQREQAWREACEPIQLEREKLIPAAEGLPTVPATVLDPFGGAGTVGLVAARLARDALLVELNPDYAELAGGRITQDAPLLHRVEAG